MNETLIAVIILTATTVAIFLMCASFIFLYEMVCYVLYRRQGGTGTIKRFLNHTAPVAPRR